MFRYTCVRQWLDSVSIKQLSEAYYLVSNEGRPKNNTKTDREICVNGTASRVLIEQPYANIDLR